MSNVVTTVGQLKEAIRDFQDDAELHIMLTEVLFNYDDKYDGTNNLSVGSSVGIYETVCDWEPRGPSLSIWINKPLISKSTI